MSNIYTGNLKQTDPEVFSSLSKELERQQNVIELIASGVESLPVKPVPPVVIIASTLLSFDQSNIVFFIKEISSLIIFLLVIL